MELHPGKFDRVHQDGGYKSKIRMVRPVRQVEKVDASTSTHQNASVQTDDEEVQRYTNPWTLTPSERWRRRFRCKAYRGRAAMTDPIERNSTQEKGTQAEERNIRSITSLQGQLRCIRLHREEGEREEEEKHELQCFNEFIDYTKREFSKAWCAIRKKNFVRVAGVEKKMICK